MEIAFAPTDISTDRIYALRPFMSEWAYNTIGDIQLKAEQYGSMTPRQKDLVLKLLSEATQKAERASQPRQVVDLSKINAMFDTASRSLKKPRVFFATYKPHPVDPRKSVVDSEFTVSTAPATGRNVGFLYVKANGGYMGKISPAGEFSPSLGCGDDVRGALEKLAADPRGEIIAYGQATGNCAICGKGLTNPASVERGIGPICFGRYGL